LQSRNQRSRRVEVESVNTYTVHLVV
jgi:hypothetical protein